MPAQLLTGNQAIGLGALRAGVGCVSGYPATPENAVFEHIASQVRRCGLAGLYLERSASAPGALKLGTEAALSGGRALVMIEPDAMGAALDPLLNLANRGVGGLVLLVADNLGLAASQTGQDTRLFGQFAKVPVLDPATPQEAATMTELAFDLSERCLTPVIVRSAAAVAQASANLEASFTYQAHQANQAQAHQNQPPDSTWHSSHSAGFRKHGLAGCLEANERLRLFTAELAQRDTLNCVEKTGRSPAPAHLGLAAGGSCWTYLIEALAEMGYVGSLRLFKVGTPYPFPDAQALRFCQGLSEALVFEGPEPFIERELWRLAGQNHLKLKIHGQLDATTAETAQNSTAVIHQHLLDYLSFDGPGRPAASLPH